MPVWWAVVRRRTANWPVSGSTSTSATWATMEVSGTVGHVAVVAGDGHRLFPAASTSSAKVMRRSERKCVTPPFDHAQFGRRERSMRSAAISSSAARGLVRGIEGGVAMDPCAAAAANTGVPGHPRGVDGLAADAVPASGPAPGPPPAASWCRRRGRRPPAMPPRSRSHRLLPGGRYRTRRPWTSTGPDRCRGRRSSPFGAW